MFHRKRPYMDNNHVTGETSNYHVLQALDTGRLSQTSAMAQAPPYACEDLREPAKPRLRLITGARPATTMARAGSAACSKAS